MYRCIIASIIESETAYLECLNIMLQVCLHNISSQFSGKGRLIRTFILQEFYTQSEAFTVTEFSKTFLS